MNDAIYYVPNTSVTPDEPRAGWYYAIEEKIHGPFFTPEDATTSFEKRSAEPVNSSGFVCADCKAPLRAGWTCDACGSDAAEDASVIAAPLVSWGWLRGIINGLPCTPSGCYELIARHDVLAWIDEGERRALIAKAGLGGAVASSEAVAGIAKFKGEYAHHEGNIKQWLRQWTRSGASREVAIRDALAKMHELHFTTFASQPGCAVEGEAE